MEFHSIFNEFVLGRKEEYDTLCHTQQINDRTKIVVETKKSKITWDGSTER